MASAINKLHMEKGWAKAIGSEDDPVVIPFTGSADGEVTLDGELGGEMWLTLTAAKKVVVEGAPSNGKGEYGLNLSGTGGSSADLTVRAGANAKIGVAPRIGNSCRFDTIKVSGGEVMLGAGLVNVAGTSAPDLTMSGGACESRMPLRNVVLIGSGTVLNHKDGLMVKLTARDNATCNYDSDGTLTGGTVIGAKLNYEGDPRSKTQTDMTAGKNATIWDPNGVVTFTNAVQLLAGVRADEVKICNGAGKKIDYDAA